jgi:hypothetical protein
MVLWYYGVMVLWCYGVMVWWCGGVVQSMAAQARSDGMPIMPMPCGSSGVTTLSGATRIVILSEAITEEELAGEAQVLC